MRANERKGLVGDEKEKNVWERPTFVALGCTHKFDRPMWYHKYYQTFRLGEQECHVGFKLGRLDGRGQLFQYNLLQWIDD